MWAILVVRADALHDGHDEGDGVVGAGLNDAAQVDVKLRGADQPAANQGLHGLKVVLGLLTPGHDEAPDHPTQKNEGVGTNRETQVLEPTKKSRCWNEQRNAGVGTNRETQVFGTNRKNQLFGTNREKQRKNRKTQVLERTEKSRCWNEQRKAKK